MLLPTSTVFESGPLDLERGGRLERLAVAYETWGRLDADGGNAILLAHGYTSNPPAARPRRLGGAAVGAGATRTAATPSGSRTAIPRPRMPPAPAAGGSR